MALASYKIVLTLLVEIINLFVYNIVICCIKWNELSHDILQSLSHLLAEMRDVNKGLQLNVDDYKQKLNDAHGDIKACYVMNILSLFKCIHKNIILCLPSNMYDFFFIYY